MDEFKPMNNLTAPPKFSGLLVILQAWKLLLIAFLVGGLLGAAVFTLFPPPYRASAVVVIDQNLEKTFPSAPDREVFYFLERETNKLEELAWSDEVLRRVSDEMRDISITQLRSGVLQLSQPSDGGWRFYAQDADPNQAKKIANSWADSFEKQVRQAVRVEQSLDIAQNELTALSTQNPVENQSRIAVLSTQVADLQNQAYGIHPQAEVFRSQKIGIQVERVSSLGYHAFVGAIAGLVLMILFGAYYFKSDHD